MIKHPAIKFNTFIPVYNWIYPLAGVATSRFANPMDVFKEKLPSQSRAIYVHIPFCESVCTFCPFVRGTNHNDETISAYVDALVQEIELKGAFPNLSGVPIGAVFFGGGTPSLLKPHHMEIIGEALHKNFDLSGCREFSLEFEVKSVSTETAEAARAMGVTHARFGGQSFQPYFRDVFNLTSSVEQLKAAAELLKAHFPFVSCDMLYGLPGQTESDFMSDIDSACELGITNLDFYPINMISTQTKLRKRFSADKRTQVSGLTKFYMNILLRSALAEKGYLPHNGHGYVKTTDLQSGSDTVVTDTYSFVYHEHVLGYPDHDLLGFGVNAVSSFYGYTVFNPASVSHYINSLRDRHLSVSVMEHSKHLDACRPLSLALPYHGAIPKDWLDWDLIPVDVATRLSKLIDNDLIDESKDSYVLTREGWEWYANVMYYLLPSEEQAEIEKILS